MAFLTDYISSSSIIIITNHRARTSTKVIKNSSGLHQLIITRKTSGPTTTSKTVISAKLAYIIFYIKKMPISTNTFLSLRVNQFELLYIAYLTLICVEFLDFAVPSWTLLNTVAFFVYGWTLFTIFAYIPSLHFDCKIREAN